MKKYRFLLLIIFIYFLSGCSVEYNLIVTDDKHVIEEMLIIVDYRAYSDEKSAAERILGNELRSYENFSEYDNYEYDYQLRGDNFNIKITKKHETLEAYFASPLNKNAFQNLYYFEDEYFSIRNSGAIYDINQGISKDSLTYIDDLKVNVRFYNQVAFANATKENSRTNTFTWLPDDNDVIKFSEIEIDLLESKRYDVIILDYIFARFWWFIIIGGFGIISIGMLFVYAVNNLKRNRI